MEKDTPQNIHFKNEINYWKILYKDTTLTQKLYTLFPKHWVIILPIPNTLFDDSPNLPYHNPSSQLSLNLLYLYKCFTIWKFSGSWGRTKI